MSSADDFRQIADECRAIPAEFGLREHTASVVVTFWTGDQPGDGDQIERLIPITVAGGAPPKVRFPSQKEITLGFYAAGQCAIGPFTPDYGSGGFDRASVNGSKLQTYEGLQIRVKGPQCPTGALYRVENSNVDHALRVTLTCSPVGE